MTDAKRVKLTHANGAEIDVKEASVDKYLAQGFSKSKKDKETPPVKKATSPGKKNEENRDGEV